MSCPIIIDGPNFINRILDYGISKEIIIEYLSLAGLRHVLNQELLSRENEECTIEFLHSGRAFGYEASQFTLSEQIQFVERLMLERGVHIDKIEVAGVKGRKEKGIDIACASRLWKKSFTHNIMAFISEDRDFIPVLKDMREIGKKVVIFSYAIKPTIEVMNEAYLYVDLRKYSTTLFPSNNMPTSKNLVDLSLKDITDFLLSVSVCFGKISMNDNGYVLFKYGGTNYQHADFDLYSNIFNGAKRGVLAASDKSFVQTILDDMHESLNKKKKRKSQQEPLNN